MKLSISNIAWSDEYDKEMYHYLDENGIEGIEIAPTRIFKEDPYSQLDGAKEYRKEMEEKYNLKISSMQSIWFGREEKIFASETDRKALIEYTKRAFEFANAIGCNNLVFGCPRNRNVGQAEDYKQIEEEFFGRLADLAKENSTVLAIEANPTIYNTDYINYTSQAFELVNRVSNNGLLVNLDVGTIIQNKEESEINIMEVNNINHVHISRPFLEYVQINAIDKEVVNKLKADRYNGYVSIEMKNNNDIDSVKQSVINLKNIVETNK